MNTDIRDSVLKLYNEGKSIIPVMAGIKCGENPICSLIGKTIIIPDYNEGIVNYKSKLLGQGADGLVWTVLVDGVEFAVKTKYSDSPLVPGRCLLHNPIDKSESGIGETIPKGSYVCEGYYSEFIIGSLCSRLYENGISANFIRMYDFAACDIEDHNKKRYRQYIFMEKVNMRLRDLPMKQLMTVDIFIQIMHAIHTYQTLYKISHNDLHMGNIMIQKIEPQHKFNGKKIMDYKYFHYRFGDTDYYVRNMGLVVKIIDFGAAQKYSKPFILNKTRRQRVPYSPIKDVRMALNVIVELISRVTLSDLDYDQSLAEYFIDLFVEIKELRNNNPSLEELEKYTPANIMESSRFVEIRPKPRKGSIITMGVA